MRSDGESALWLSFAALVAGLFIALVAAICIALNEYIGSNAASLITANSVATENLQISKLNSELADKNSELDAASSELNATKTSINDALSIRAKIASELLKSATEISLINPTSGDLGISAARLFEGSALKDSARFDLRRILRAYLGTLMLDKNRANIDKIIILSSVAGDDKPKNFELAQRRSNELISFINNSVFKDDAISAAPIISGATTNTQVSELRIHFVLSENAIRQILKN